jgi:hypothetical protein
MSFEMPIKGNPRKLTIKQHIHTAYSIKKFCSENKVEVYFLESKKIEKRKSDAEIFCAKRNWDQKTEAGLMCDIEREFHKEIDNIKTKTFDSRNHQAISRYFLLWNIRGYLRRSPISNTPLDNISCENLTKEQEENLETKGCAFTRFTTDGKTIMPSRFITGSILLRELDKHWPEVENFKWGLLTSLDGEFIVSDFYKGLTFMPIGPKIALAVGYSDTIISRDSVANANKESKIISSEYYFAKNLNDCPIAE